MAWQKIKYLELTSLDSGRHSSTVSTQITEIVMQ